jgi:hypothetical protein
MKRILFACALSLAAALPAAAQEPRWHEIGPFDRINIMGIAQVELTQGDKDQVQVLGDQKAKLILSEGRLMVSTDDNWKFWSRDTVQMRIQVRELTQLTISGASDVTAPHPFTAKDLRVSISGQGKVQMPSLTAQQLRFNVSGAGDGNFGGEVKDLQINLAGKGRVLADKLKAEMGAVTISGIGNADVWVTRELKLTVSGIGTVNYWGQPLLNRKTSGIATVNGMGEKKP